MGAAQQHLLAVEAHAQEAAKMVAEMGAQDAMSAEFAEGITQNEAAAMAAVSEAQQQVALQPIRPAAVAIHMMHASEATKHAAGAGTVCAPALRHVYRNDQTSRPQISSGRVRAHRITYIIRRCWCRSSRVSRTR